MTCQLPFRIRIGAPEPTCIVRLPPPGTPDEAKRCGMCGRWLPPSKFESKGQRGGQQVRRTTCEDCRQFRARALKPLLPATYGDTRGLEDELRTCKGCGKARKVREFQKCAPAPSGEVYRSWTCRACHWRRERAAYRAAHWARS